MSLVNENEAQLVRLTLNTCCRMPKWLYFSIAIYCVINSAATENVENEKIFLLSSLRNQVKSWDNMSRLIRELK